MKKMLNPFALCALLLLICAVLSVMVGSSMIPLRTILDIIVSSLRSTAAQSDPNGVFSTILFSLRLPHMFLLLLVGAALAGSGAAYQ